MSMKTLLRENRNDCALILGNGVNIYGAAQDTNSWQDLLVRLAKRHLPAKLRDVPDGVALTEFYDVLELKSNNSESKGLLQKEFCDLMSNWQFYGHHARIVEWARYHSSPILTTNFEETLSAAGECKLLKTKKKGFTDYYPWESYFGTNQIRDPSQEFGIWHINGMENYRRSVRLGLTHYMGSVERARRWIHKGNEKIQFSGKNKDGWRGASSWLHIIFNTPLVIFGLGLEENEVFLRWLLIERAKYFKKYPNRFKKAWFVHTGEMKSEGKRFFLEGVGITLLRVETYSEIYGVDSWRTDN